VIDHYDWAGGREQMLRFGPDDGPIVVVALPLFEEANRTRTFAVTLCRALAGHGIGSAIPDLPGQGESVVPTEQVRLNDLRVAFAAAAGSLERPADSVAIRSGALLDGEAAVTSRWHFAPQEGASLARDLARVRQAAGFTAEPEGDVIEVAGNLLSRGLLAELQTPLPKGEAPLRTIRLESDPQPADRQIDAAPLWRRTEPGNDPALAALLAKDIAQWITACAD
jgi:hypothetical protein